jgi:hypothetical protein
VKNGKKCLPKMQIKKEKSLRDYLMFKNQDYFTIMECSKDQRRGQCLSPHPLLLRIAIALPVLGVIIFGAPEWWGQAEGEAPWNVMIGAKLVVYPK